MGVTAALLSRRVPLASQANGAGTRGHVPSGSPAGGAGAAVSHAGPGLSAAGAALRPVGAAYRSAGAGYRPANAGRYEHAAVQFCGPGSSCGAAHGAPGADAGALRSELGAGEALPARAAASFGAAFGSSLGGVSVHRASPVPGRFGARAVTVGSHVAFAPGRYEPGSLAGRELLGHELAHVVQQRGGSVGVQAGGGAGAGEAHEVEADAAARAVVHGGVVPTLSPVTAPTGQGDNGPMCRVTPPVAQSRQVCEAPRPDPFAPQVCQGPPADAPLLRGTGTQQERIAAFKSLVRTTAILRLRGNQSNLAQWSELIANTIPTGDLAAAGLLQTGGSAPYFELQDITDPAMRELRATQAEGKNRACTGCHLQTQIMGSRTERSRLGGREWLSPNQQRSGAPTPGFERWATAPPLTDLTGGGGSGGDISEADRDAFVRWAVGGPGGGSGGSGSQLPLVSPGLGYNPPAGTAEGRLHRLFPDPSVVREQMERARPIIAALGPDGYKVLPGDILAMLGTGTPDAVRCRIRSAIRERSEGYETLIGKIRSGELGYEHFGPIIRDLLPAADPEVRRVIQKEMDDKAFWDKVEAVVVGVLTVALLLLTIFPPTSALGLTALGALEVGLGVYGAVKGPGMIETGQAYSLGTGAHDVFSRQQQEAGGMMVLGGFLGIALAPLAVVGGMSRMASATTRIGGLSLAGVEAGQTLQRGKYLMTLAEDGSLVVTLADRADVIIIVRGQTATAYQLTGTGMRVLETAHVPAPAATGAGARLGSETPLALPAPKPYTEPGPIILPSRAPAAGEAPAYLMPLGAEGQGGVLVMGRGLRPADFGLAPIADDAAMLTMWNDAMRASATSGRANAYTRYLDAVADGSVAGWTSEQLNAAFDVVNSRFLAAARSAGNDIATVHHWNFPKSRYPYAITDPRHLVPVPEQAALRGGWHPVHQGGLHPLTTVNPARPTAGPVAPVHEIDLGPFASPLPPR